MTNYIHLTKIIIQKIACLRMYKLNEWFIDKSILFYCLISNTNFRTLIKHKNHHILHCTRTKLGAIIIIYYLQYVKESNSKKLKVDANVITSAKIIRVKMNSLSP